jgi:hypothetical protein
MLILPPSGCHPTRLAVRHPPTPTAVAFSCRVLSEGGDLLHDTEAEAPRVLLLGDPLVSGEAQRIL